MDDRRLTIDRVRNLSSNQKKCNSDHLFGLATFKDRLELSCGLTASLDDLTASCALLRSSAAAGGSDASARSETDHAPLDLGSIPALVQALEAAVSWLPPVGGRTRPLKPK